MNKPKLTPDRLREVLHYEPLTGQFTWRETLSRRAKKGTKVGCLCKRELRIVLAVDGVQYLAHRLAWLYMTGEWPKGQIDHENGDPSNNIFTNLRNATGEQNARNQRAKPNKSGLKGAAWDASRQLYIATIRTDTGRKHLGRFKEASDAHEAYKAAAAFYHKEFARYA